MRLRTFFIGCILYMKHVFREFSFYMAVFMLCLLPPIGRITEVLVYTGANGQYARHDVTRFIQYYLLIYGDDDLFLYSITSKIEEYLGYKLVCIVFNYKDTYGAELTSVHKTFNKYVTF
jgi:hypothetical protein